MPTTVDTGGGGSSHGLSWDRDELEEAELVQRFADQQPFLYSVSRGCIRTRFVAGGAPGHLRLHLVALQQKHGIDPQVTTAHLMRRGSRSTITSSGFRLPLWFP